MTLAANAAFLIGWQVSFTELLTWESRDVLLLQEMVDGAAARKGQGNA
jgi:hypothetical protein